LNIKNDDTDEICKYVPGTGISYVTVCVCLLFRFVTQLSYGWQPIRMLSLVTELVLCALLCYVVVRGSLLFGSGGQLLRLSMIVMTEAHYVFLCSTSISMRAAS